MVRNMRTQTVSKLIAVGLLSLIVSSHAFAGKGGDGRERRGPPPEALEACASLNLDQACSFTSPHGEVSGTCIVPKNDDSALACKPERGGKGRERGEKAAQ